MIFDDSTIQNGRFNRLKWGCWPPVIQPGHIKRIDGAWIVCWCTELKHYVVIFHSKLLVYQRHQFFLVGVVKFCLIFFLFFFAVRSVHNVWTENWGTNRIQHAQEQLSPKDLEAFDVPLSSMVTRDLTGDMDAADLREIFGFRVAAPFFLMQMFDIADDRYWIKWMKLILLCCHDWLLV